MTLLLARQLETTRDTLAAELAQAEEEIRLAKARLSADLRLAQVELGVARDEHERFVRAGPWAVSASELSKAIARVREAEAKVARARVPVEERKLEVLRQRLAAAEKDHAFKERELGIKRAAKQAEVEAARYDLAAMEREGQQAVLVAPLDGVVTTGEVKVGDLLEPGRPVVEIAEEKGFRFELFVPTEEVGRLQLGMPARVKLYAFDYQRYGSVTGTVCFISPDSGVPQGQQAAFYTVRIALDGDEVGRETFRGQLKLGMVGQGEIVTGQETILSLLLKKIRQSISLG
jgi:multidrug resistance efflux pump